MRAHRCANFWMARMVALLSVGGAPLATGATLSLSVESEALYAGMPFTLTLSAKDFEEEPVPDAPELVIDGCEVTYLGVNPSVSTRVEIVNGRRSDWRDVTFNYRWRVSAPAAGRYTIPPLSLGQGDVEARIASAAFEVTDVPATEDMTVRLRLPDRAVWVGETFDATVEWLLARDVDDYEFAVPLFDVDGAEVAEVEGAATGRESVRFAAGAQEIRLPLQRNTVQEGGRQYTRFSFPARITLNNVGTLDLAPIRVVARLQSGTTRDGFGFRRPRYQLFKAEGERQRLMVRPLPLAGRPATFVNAIGDGFSINVSASRTVVSVGEPIELIVGLRGAGPLTGLSLPPLAGPEALPVTQFSVPEGSTAGMIDAETRTKRFPVTVRVKSAEVREVPPIAFSYFDPGAGEYRTVHSEPIALSVGAGQVIGAADVVAARATTSAGIDSAATPGQSAALATLLGAGMAISDPARTFGRPWGSDGVGFWVGGLYGVPLLIALISVWLRRTGDARGHARDIRRALAVVETALDAGQAAREAAPVIAAAMRRLATAAGTDPRPAGALLEGLETRAFDPAAAGERVGDDIIGELRSIAQQWAKIGAARGSGTVVGLTAVLVAVLLTAGPADADDAITDARASYAAALAETDRLRRVRLFDQAAQALGEIALSNPAAAELQVDWGNAALGAQERGWAVLAWRRALRVDPGNERATRNLFWLRDRLPVWLPRPASAGALDSLLFWRDRLTTAQLHVIGATGFAVAVLLVVPWFRRRWAWRRALAIPAALVWIAATGSALLAADAVNDAVVVVDGVTLRSADSPGASPAFANPLPAGTEVTVVEDRAAWLRVTLADGTRGWLAASVLEKVNQPTS